MFFYSLLSLIFLGLELFFFWHMDDTPLLDARELSGSANAELVLPRAKNFVGQNLASRSQPEAQKEFCTNRQVSS